MQALLFGFRLGQSLNDFSQHTILQFKRADSSDSISSFQPGNNDDFAAIDSAHGDFFACRAVGSGRTRFGVWAAFTVPSR